MKATFYFASVLMLAGALSASAANHNEKNFNGAFNGKPVPAIEVNCPGFGHGPMEKGGAFRKVEPRRGEPRPGEFRKGPGPRGDFRGPKAGPRPKGPRPPKGDAVRIHIGGRIIDIRL